MGVGEGVRPELVPGGAEASLSTRAPRCPRSSCPPQARSCRPAGARKHPDSVLLLPSIPIPSLSVQGSSSSPRDAGAAAQAAAADEDNFSFCFFTPDPGQILRLHRLTDSVCGSVSSVSRADHPTAVSRQSCRSAASCGLRTSGGSSLRRGGTAPHRTAPQRLELILLVPAPGLRSADPHGGGGGAAPHTSTLNSAPFVNAECLRSMFPAAPPGCLVTTFSLFGWRPHRIERHSRSSQNSKRSEQLRVFLQPTRSLRDG